MSGLNLQALLLVLHDDALRDRLAATEHERWAHWQSYMHSRGHRNADGSLTLPPDLVARWDGQISRRFNELSEAEQDSDREQVERYLPLIEEALRGAG